MNSISLQPEATFTENPIAPGNKPVKNAVILAAGKSSRFRDQGVLKPKVLMQVGGLGLLERAILTLHSTGIEHFRITVGAYKEQVLAEMKSLPRLQHIDIEYVECDDYELGNGVSFAAGAAGFTDAFLLTMSDHIFAPETIADFVQKTSVTPHLPALACDADLENIFDMDDATKVASRDGFIHNIGKEIKEYDLVDTGLFYFPKGYGSTIAEKANQGAHSVSGIIQHFIDGDGVRAVVLDNAQWQDVDDPNMKQEAERRLKTMFKTPEAARLIKPKEQEEQQKSSFIAKFKKYLPYILGLGILASLVFYVPFDLVGNAFTQFGNKVFLVFSVAILWILTNTLCTFTLVRGKVPFWDVLYNQITGEGYNTILPLASVGGEPYRIQHLSNWIDIHDASRAVLADRLIRAITGILFAATCLFITLAIVKLSSATFITVMLLAVAHLVVGIGITWVSLSQAPSKLVNVVLKKLKMVEDYRNEPIPAGRFFKAMGYKFISRIFSLVEMYAIFNLLGFDPSMGDIITIAGFIAVSASVFFMPGGLIVNEIGILFALNILGYSDTVIFNFSLLRRTSVIFWALLGVALHLSFTVFKKLDFSRA
ncbi:MAG: NTP transferase domain-containing protein [Bacteroidetes bacterium]|nr:NTP transferase domain-containing protein [Bacteroidota bacterium]